MSKRKAEEYESPWVNCRDKRPKVRAAAVLESLCGSFINLENRALMQENNRLARHVTDQRDHILELERRIRRMTTINRMLHERIARLEGEATWRRGIIDDVFARFPEVGHEYDWLNAAEELADAETESEEEFALDEIRHRRNQ